MMAGVTDDEVVRFDGVPELIDIDGWLRLRPWTLDDVPAQVRVVNANLEHLRPWMPWAQEAATDESQGGFVRDSLRQWVEGTTFNYAICTTAGEIVGSCGLMARRGPGVLEIGYWVAADHGGRGIATAVSRALTDLARGVDGCERVEIHCDEANVRSAAVPRRLGFTLLRTELRELTAPGEAGRSQVWGLDVSSG